MTQEIFKDDQQGQKLDRPQGGLVVPGKEALSMRGAELEVPQDAVIEELIQLLSRPTQPLTTEAYGDSIRKRQEAVNAFLNRGGAETLRRLFERIKQVEAREPIKIDLSMLEVSGRILGDLYLPGANLEKLIFTDSDISGSNLHSANLTAAVATDAIMRGIIGTGSNWTNAVIPGADLSGARFVGARFINTDMTDVKVDEQTNFAGAKFVGTYLGRTDLSAANLVGAVFRGIRR